MKTLEKSKKELVLEHDRLCDEHDELLEKYKKRAKNKTFVDRSIYKIKLLIELRKLEERIDILSDAICSVDAKMSLFKEMPKAEIDSTKIINVSSDSVKKSIDSMKNIIKKEYKKLDKLVYKKVLSQLFVDERRKGIAKYDFGPVPALGFVMGAWIFGMPAASLLEAVFSFSNLSFLIPVGIGATIGMSIAVAAKIYITKKRIEIFNTLNSELGEDKLAMINDDGMQETYDLNSKIAKKCHDIMTMETICKDQERNYEIAKEQENISKFENDLKVQPGLVHTPHQYSADKLVCNTGRWAGYEDIPSNYPSKILVEGSCRTERDDTIEMGELYRHLEDDDYQPRLKR